MKRILLEIKALSPLAIARQKPGGSISEVESYIPGSVIRGAIAAQILQKYRQLQQSEQQQEWSQDFSENGGDFQALFLDDTPAIFQNAYPATIEIKDKTILQPEVRVLPTTALSSKNSSGFTSKKGSNGVFDTLIDRFCAEGYGYPYDPNCPTDGGRVDAHSCFYSKLNDKYHAHSVNKRLLTRVGINRRLATAEEEILYSIEVLNESESKGKKPKPVIYCGSILVEDSLADSLTQFILDRSENFRLGGSTSRGLGKVKIQAKIVDIKPNVVAKVENFNEKLGQRWKEWRVFGSPLKELAIDRTYFSLDLHSEAILTDNWQGTTVISEEMLKKFTGVKDSTLKLEAAYSSYDYRSGWNSAWGLMKDVELITNKGAVYLFSTAQRDAWMKALENLEIVGVGDRTCEGFGQIEVCNEFHLVFQEEPV
ncbi:CRISPR-associated RAMP protein Csx10 [Aerosakkonema sp. BLCC-F183]|uniref:type III-D CRISPR-associated RAMP protein Csx10 n=1 Tax=Aerosakkonema sp. BLCC-F183 TaxID=3342834 RepID=UPI0035B81B1F